MRQRQHGDAALPEIWCAPNYSPYTTPGTKPRIKSASITMIEPWVMKENQVLCPQ